MAATKGPGRPRAPEARRKRSAQDKARRQVLDDLDDLHEHVQGLEDALADMAEVQRVSAAATVVMARAMVALLEFAAVDMPRAAGQAPLPKLSEALEALEGELAKLEDVHDLMDHLDHYRDAVIKP
jgi:hypothetical protein